MRESEQTPRTGGRQEIHWWQLAWGGRVALALVSQLFPLLLLISLLVGGSYPLWTLAAVVPAMLVLLIAYMVAYAYSRRLPIALVGSLFASCFVYAFLAPKLSIPSHVLFVFFILACAYRLVRLHRAPVAADENLVSFRFESLVGGVWTLLFLLLQANSTATSGRNTMTNLYIGLWLVLFVSRAAWMWYLERRETGTASKWNTTGLGAWVVLVVLGAVFGPLLIWKAYAGILLAFVDFMLPFLAYLLPNVLRTRNHHQQTSSTTTNLHQKPIPTPAHTSSGMVHAIEWIVVLALLGAAIYILVRLTQTKIEARQGADAVSVDSVQRVWLSKMRGLRFAETNDVQRLQYQAWLRDLTNRRVELSAVETPRELAKRVLAIADDADGITKKYEIARYRK